MRIFLSLILFLVTSTAFGATCTGISRSNYNTNQVLTSSQLNTDFNTAYSAANAFDGGCVNAGSLEFDALNTTQFSPLLKGVREGCKVTYSNASTVLISKCFAAVNGNYVYTTSSTSAAFGCAGCSGEVASTTYYVYIQTGSSATTITPLISTTAPNEDGYDNSGNKVVGRFFNNAASDIDEYSIDQWHVNEFIPKKTAWVTCGLAAGDFVGFGTPTSISLKCRREGTDLLIRGTFLCGTATATEGRINLKINGVALTSISDISTVEMAGGNITNAPSSAGRLGYTLIEPTKTYLTFGYSDQGTGTLTKANANAICTTATTHGLGISARIPINGWNL